MSILIVEEEDVVISYYLVFAINPLKLLCHLQCFIWASIINYDHLKISTTEITHQKNK